MKVSREISNKIKFFIDNFVPPIIRDAKWFLFLPFKYQFKKDANLYFNFRNNAYLMTNDEFIEAYKKANGTLIHNGTDLNKKCFDEILKNVKGDKVLDIACGRGDLSNELSKNHKVVACDIVKSDFIVENKNLKFVKSNIEKLPFEDNEFDTVISTHTLEHVKDIRKAIDELRRVCKKRLIIVLPKERPYRFGFNFHLHFFPYEYSLYPFFSSADSRSMKIDEIDGDWYIEQEP